MKSKFNEMDCPNPLQITIVLRQIYFKFGAKALPRRWRGIRIAKLANSLSEL